MTYGGGTQWNGLAKQHVVAGFESRALWLSGNVLSQHSHQDTPR